MSPKTAAYCGQSKRMPKRALSSFRASKPTVNAILVSQHTCYLLTLLLIMCHQAVLHVHALQVPSFLERGHAVPCARGQLVDLTALFPYSDPKLNCIQNHEGVWFSCQCPEGFIKCEEYPSCAQHVLKSSVDLSAGRMNPAASPSYGINLKSSLMPSVPKAKSPKTPKARRGEHKPKHQAATTRQATLELKHDERSHKQQQEELSADGSEGDRLLALALGIPLSNVLATKNTGAKRMRERTSATSVPPTTAPSTTTTLLTTTSTTNPALLLTTTITTTHEPSTTEEPEEASTTTEADVEPATEEDFDTNRLQARPIDVESLINPINEPPPVLVPPVWPAIPAVHSDGTGPTSGDSEVEQATNEAMFYVALGVELFVLGVIVTLALYFWYKDAQMSRKDAERGTKASSMSLNKAQRGYLCKPSAPKDGSSSAISLVSNDSDKQQLNQLPV